ncbi:MAG: aldehyde ferredoxin oxidoreductase N-terminal domain-containing protein, partial [Thermodesulfobacteriota bacterium]
MAKGWRGRLLRVNLTKGEGRAEDIPPQVLKDYIGGRGLGIYYLNREMDPAADPLSPDNVLVMAAGPLTGTLAATGCRYMITTKSPLSGALTASNSGGYFPTELKKAGYDALLFQGRSPEPVYLWLDGPDAELRPAGHLWGRTVPEATQRVLEETDPQAKVSCIGPAGEKMVLFAAVMNDVHRAAGRSGVGAVLGSKNLKAVAVKGRGKVPLHDPDGFMAFHKELLRTYKKAAEKNPPAIRQYGTSYGVAVMNGFGILPTKNFQQGTFDKWEKINGPTLNNNYVTSRKACFACPIGCGRYSKVNEGGFISEGEGPEYETIYALGACCLVDYLPAVIKANHLCNELGLDTMTMGVTVACAMELV